MAISLADNLAIQGKKQNIERDAFATIAEMKAFNENYLPDIFHSVCYEDGKMYLFNRANAKDPTTGKWREIGGSPVWRGTKAEFEAQKDNILNNSLILITDD